MDMNFVQPPGYPDGAYQVEILLNEEEEQLVNLYGPLLFVLPKLEKRQVLSDSRFRAVTKLAGEMLIVGQFAQGQWCGHVYSNGIAEASNPTPIKDVLEELQVSVEVGLAGLREWSALQQHK